MTRKDLMIGKTKQTWKALVTSFLVHATLLMLTTHCLIIFYRLLEKGVDNLGTAASILIGVISMLLYMIVFASVVISAIERIDAEMQQLINYISVGADFIEHESVTNFENSVGRRIPKEELGVYGYMELSDEETDCYCRGELIRHEESIEGVEID